MRVHYGCLFAGLALLWIGACNAAPVQQLRTTIVAQYPHDPAAFTQGLLVSNGVLFESTGEYGHSSVRRVDLESGRVLQSTALDDTYFGEGLTLAQGRLFQLTWKAGIAFVYDPDSLERIGRFDYRGQGWGLTWNGERLIMSDGSATLRLLDPSDFRVTGRIRVTEDGRPLRRLNELEYVDGAILANVWFEDRVVRIEPDTGRVTASIDAAALRAALPEDSDDINALNGIAWDAQRRRLYLTGKNWPRLFEVAWPPKPPAATHE